VESNRFTAFDPGPLPTGGRGRFRDILRTWAHTAGVLVAARHVRGRRGNVDVEARPGTRVAALVSRGVVVCIRCLRDWGRDKRVAKADRLREQPCTCQHEHQQICN
jgi:hypothetical protein